MLCAVTGEVIASVSAATSDDVDRAVQAPTPNAAKRPPATNRSTATPLGRVQAARACLNSEGWGYKSTGAQARELAPATVSLRSYELRLITLRCVGTACGHLAQARRSDCGAEG